MNGPDILASFRAQLVEALSTAPDHPTPPEPLQVSPWVAMSLMQKSIRRREEQFALQAAATLLHSAPDRLWRRLGCIVFEDIGLADPETLGLDLHRRALALWYAVGTERRPSDHLRQRRGNPTAVFDHLCDVGYPHTLVEIAREGFRLTSEMLCPFVVLLQPEYRSAAKTITDDNLPSTEMCGPVPGWALDIYSQEGRRAFSRFLRTNCPTAEWICANVHPQRRVKFLGDLVFKVEGGLLRQRERWPLANQLRRMFVMECLGHECSDPTEVLDMTRNDLPVLNEVRHV